MHSIDQIPPGNMAVQCRTFLVLNSNRGADFLSNPVLPFGTNSWLVGHVNFQLSAVNVLMEQTIIMTRGASKEASRYKKIDKSS